MHPGCNISLSQLNAEELISSDEACPKSVRAAGALDREAFDPQLPIQDLQRQPQIELLLTKDAGDTVFAQSRQIRVSDLFREHHDKRVAGNPQAIRHCPGDNCRPSRGTEGSNPSSSSAESIANSRLRLGANSRQSRREQPLQERRSIEA